MPKKIPPVSVYAWKRFWTPWTQGIQMEWGHDQYLADPESKYAGNTHLKELQELKLAEPGCIVLCGEPGMGKTQTLAAWLVDNTSNVSVISVDFRTLPDRLRFDELVFKTNAWATWKAANGVLMVVVDGVDEGLIKIPGFLDYLTDRLRAEPVQRLRLVLTCRSLDWPVSEGDRLMALWATTPVPKIYELCPLRRKDVALAAKQSGLNTGAFLSAVRKDGLVAFATRPLTLRMLIDSFRQGRGFAKTRGELIRTHILTLCEGDPERRRRLQTLKPSLARYTTDEIYRTARGIAALLLLGGRSTIHMGAKKDVQARDLGIDEIVASFADVKAVINLEMVRQALDSPLFSARGPERVGFYHQVLAEVLAADFLRILPLRQQIQLLGDRDSWGRYVEPPLAEVAGWLAADAKEFRAFLLENEPATLLRADVSKYTADEKAEVVATVLARARSGRLFDGNDERRYYHGLKHPGLAQQLRVCLVDQSVNLVARRLALTIARECQVHALFADLLGRLNDPVDAKIHYAAGFALQDLARPGDKAKLLALVRAPGAVDARTCFGAAIALLENELVPLRDLLPDLPKLLIGSFSNGYLLAQYAKTADLMPLLQASESWKGRADSTRDYGALKTAVFKLGIEQWRNPVVRCALAATWLKNVQSGGGIGDELAKLFREAGKADPVARRKFLAELAGGTVWKHHELAALSNHILIEADFVWLLQTVLKTSGRRRQNYGRLAGWLYRADVHHPFLSELLKVHKKVAATAAELPWMRLWLLGSPETEHRKKQYYEYEAPQAPRPKPVGPKPRDIWAANAAALPGKNPTYWVQVANDLFYTGDRVGHGLPNDVMRAPGWKTLTGAQRQACAVAAAWFLKKTSRAKKEHGSIDNYDIAAYLAIKLLRSRWEKSDHGLRRAVVKKWLPVLLGWWEDDKAKRSMIASVWRIAPAELLKWQRITLEREAAADSPHLMSVRDYEKCWEPALRQNVVDWALAKLRRAVVLRSLARELMKVDPVAVRELWRQLSRKKRVGTAERAAVLGGWLAQNLACDWKEIQKALMSDDVLAREALLVAAGDYDGMVSDRKAVKAKPEMVADLYLLVRRLFPPTAETFPGGGGLVTPLMDLGRWRDSLPGQLAAMGSEVACRELERVAGALPAEEAIWVRWKLYDGIAAMRRRAWMPVTPDVIGQMAADADSIFLRSEDDLLALVIESLERMAATPDARVQDFWVDKVVKGEKVRVPAREERITELIGMWLRLDLDPKRAIMIQREVQVQRRHRTDLEVRTVGLKGSKLRPLEVTIEVKGDWNVGVMSSARGQLVDRYLRRAGRTHGIYLVVWTGDATVAYAKGIPSISLDLAKAELAEVVKQAVLPGENFVVAGVLIDARDI